MAVHFAAVRRSSEKSQREVVNAVASFTGHFVTG
jgi:hypothetical protein